MRFIERLIDFYNSHKVAKVIVGLLTVIIVLLYFISSSIKGGDFVTFLEASTKMWNNQNIYDPPYINLRYSYSPFWAMILVPFALLPKGFGAFIWLVLNVIFLWRTIKLLQSIFQISIGDRKHNAILWFCIMLYMSRYIELNFHHVQMTIFLLWLILESLTFANRDKEIWAGIVIGLGSIIKIMPVIMIPYLIFRRRFLAVFSSILTILLAFFIPMIFVGREMFWALNKSWYSILRPDSPEFQTDALWFMPQNLSAFMYRILVNTGAPYSNNLFNFNYSQASTYIWAIVIVLTIFSFYFFNTMPFKRIYDIRRQLYEVSYLVLLIPLIFPHQMKYAFYFVLPSVCCLFLVLIQNYSSQKSTYQYRITAALLIVSFMLCTMTTDLIIGMNLSIISQHLKTITIGTLILIPALAINRDFFIDHP